jgi:hypothetical protein
VSNPEQAWLDRQREKRSQAEVEVMGTAMRHPQLMDDIVAKVEPAMFRDGAHRRLADALWSLHREGKPTEMDTVLDRLIGRDHIDEVGGPERLFDVWSAGSFQPSTDACDELLALEHRRGVFTACRHGMTAATNPDVEPAAVAADVVASLSTVGRDEEDTGPITTTELLRREVPERLIEGVLPAGVSLLFGPPKGGKTYVALSMAYAIARGAPWFGRRTRRPGNVLYLAGEGVDDASIRVDALCELYDDEPGGHLLWWDEPLKLSNPRDAARLRLWVAREGVGLVVVDTWRRFSGLRDENDASATATAVGVLEDLTRKGVSSLVVHHSNKDGEVRGSTALDGAVEAALHVRHHPTEGRMVVSSYLTRRGTGFPSMDLVWHRSGKDAVVVPKGWKPPEPQPRML